MSDEKKRKTRKRGFFSNYFIYVFSFLIIGAVIFAAALCIADKPVKQMVYKAEAALAMEVRDVKTDDSRYPLTEGTDDSVESIAFGDRTGNVTIENRGVNCSVYYGCNRVSMRYGAGFLSESESLDSGNKVKVIGGYDETFFSGLKYVQKGDIIKINTNLGEYEYCVSDVKYIASDKEPYKSEDMDMLVLYSIFSDFSNHSGEYLYVFADRVNGEDG